MPGIKVHYKTRNAFKAWCGTTNPGSWSPAVDGGWIEFEGEKVYFEPVNCQRCLAKIRKAQESQRQRVAAYNKLPVWRVTLVNKISMEHHVTHVRCESKMAAERNAQYKVGRENDYDWTVYTVIDCDQVQ